MKSKLKKSQAILRLKEIKKMKAQENYLKDRLIAEQCLTEVNNKQLEIDNLIGAHSQYLTSNNLINPVFMENALGYLSAQEKLLLNHQAGFHKANTEAEEKRECFLSSLTKVRVFEKFTERTQKEYAKQLSKTEALLSEAKPKFDLFGEPR